MRYKGNYIWNCVCTIVFVFIAVDDIINGRAWQSLIWFMNSLLTISSCFFLQNKEKIEKLDEIKKILENKEE